MLRYIVGGLALGAIGYGLGKYFSENEYCCDYLNKFDQNINDDVDKTLCKISF